MTLVDILALIHEGIAFSHGYTLSVWSAGMMAIRRYGNPRARDIILFLAGASLAYSMFGVAVIFKTATERLPMHSSTPVIGLAPLTSALTSAISSALVTRIIWGRSAGYLIAGFVTTFVYVVILALFLSYIMS